MEKVVFYGDEEDDAPSLGANEYWARQNDLPPTSQ